MHKLLYGAHISIAGGIDNSIAIGQSIGCTAIQIFTKSNRQWNCGELTQQEIDLYKKALNLSTIKIVIAHTAYLINIGSPKNDIEQKSIQSLITELDRCNKLTIPYLVVHPGSHLEGSEQECLEKISNNINIIFEKHPGTTMLLLELMPGQGSSVCYSFEQLAFVYNKVKIKSRLGICFDTAHAWAAGYDFSTQEKYDSMWKHFDKIIGIENLKVIHVNDSKSLLKSHIDRHETIGEGTIGLEAFKMLINDERFFDIPKIIETPHKTIADDEYNLNILKDLLLPSTRKKLNIIE